MERDTTLSELMMKKLWRKPIQDLIMNLVLSLLIWKDCDNLMLERGQFSSYFGL